jgi:hypothetical protein
MDDQTAISRIKQGDLTGLDILVNRYQVRAVHRKEHPPLLLVIR